jgi:Putative DNA-binding domain
VEVSGPFEEELLTRLRRFEDNLVERKTVSDKKDWLKTIVAFANSTPTGQTAVLFIGVTDKGKIEAKQIDLDTAQKTLDRELEKAYPPIECRAHIIEKDGRQALAIIVPSSEKKPHFAGPSYIRRFSSTYEASEQEFAELIARRNSMVDKILQHKGKWVTVVNSPRNNPRMGESYWPTTTTVFDCDQFGVTLATGDQPRERQTFPLRQIELSHDHQFDRLIIKIDR